MNTLKYLIPLVTCVLLVGCGGSATAVTPEPDIKKGLPVVPILSLSFTPTKAFSFSWAPVPGATSYKLKEDITSGSGYEVIETTTATSFDHIVPLYARVNAKYILESCNAGGCTASAAVFTMPRLAEMTSSIGYLKASNTDINDRFGYSLSLSDDGNTLAVGAYAEASNSQMVNVGQDNGAALGSGAVYVFTRDKERNAVWSQQAYLKASNSRTLDYFGLAVSLSDDGSTLSVGAPYEDNNGKDSGAAYVFTRDNNDDWSEQGYLKATNAGEGDFFGTSVSLSDDGNTLAVGAPNEDSNSKVIDNTGVDDGTTDNSGAVYVFTRSVVDSEGEGGEEASLAWSQQTYIKATNSGAVDQFGNSVSFSGDGITLAVGAYSEDSSSTMIEQDNNDAADAGAVYVFTYSDTQWIQQAYLKAGNTSIGDQFGRSVSISVDGNTLVVGAPGEDSSATGVNNAHQGEGAEESGAAYVFTRSGLEANSTWAQQAYLKPSNTDVSDLFGYWVSISADGNTVAVNSEVESSNAAGIDATQTNNLAPNSGAVYTFTRSADVWSAQAYIKAKNPGENHRFGSSLALSANGATLAVGAYGESSNAKGVNQDQQNGSFSDAGAVYLY